MLKFIRLRANFHKQYLAMCEYIANVDEQKMRNLAIFHTCASLISEYMGCLLHLNNCRTIACKENNSF